MSQPVTLPLWLFVLILLFAAVTFASHFLFPSVRWFFRKRMERAVARLNQRLKRPIAPFKLARRHDMIERLVHDPAVAGAMVDHSRRNAVPEAVAFQLARKYAREIVPAFSASVYFGFGARLARWMSQSLYNVRIGTAERGPLDGIPPDAAVVFVMNHRSNMDYVLVTHLVSGQSDLSYAVGEWARIWPLSWLIRAMGAYFIQRGARGPLYRRVLERYVQMATAGGVTQAVFPEGGLSLDGRIAPPRLGILSYIAEGWSPGGRDVVFVPVALNYDRVIEDRFLVAAGLSGERRFRPPLAYLLGAGLRHLGLRLTGRFRRLGTATVSFGTPLALSAAMEEGGLSSEALARRLMAGIAAVVPVLPVPLVARLLLTEGPMPRAALIARVDACFAGLARRGIAVPRRSADTAVADAVTLLASRGLVEERGGTIAPGAAGGPLLSYYAASIEHHFGGAGFPALPAGMAPP